MIREQAKKSTLTTDFIKSGELIESVQRKPYAVIVFDNAEKACPSLRNSLLQVLNESRLIVGLVIFLFESIIH